MHPAPNGVFGFSGLVAWSGVMKVASNGSSHCQRYYSISVVERVMGWWSVSTKFHPPPRLFSQFDFLLVVPVPVHTVVVVVIHQTMLARLGLCHLPGLNMPFQ
jgi:hypothetical protein